MKQPQQLQEQQATTPEELSEQQYIQYQEQEQQRQQENAKRQLNRQKMVQKMTHKYNPNLHTDTEVEPFPPRTDEDERQRLRDLHYIDEQYVSGELSQCLFSKYLENNRAERDLQYQYYTDPEANHLRAYMPSNFPDAFKKTSGDVSEAEGKDQLQLDQQLQQHEQELQQLQLERYRSKHQQKRQQLQQQQDQQSQQNNQNQRPQESSSRSSTDVVNPLTETYLPINAFMQFHPWDSEVRHSDSIEFVEKETDQDVEDTSKLPATNVSLPSRKGHAPTPADFQDESENTHFIMGTKDYGPNSSAERKMRQLERLRRYDEIFQSGLVEPSRFSEYLERSRLLRTKMWCYYTDPRANYIRDELPTHIPQSAFVLDDEGKTIHVPPYALTLEDVARLQLSRSRNESFKLGLG
jgi:hypothetical protein